MVGDSLRDIQAYVRVGGAPMLVLTGNGRKTRRDPAFGKATPVYADLAAAVEALLA